jgi:rubrerythrin
MDDSVAENDVSDSVSDGGVNSLGPHSGHEVIDLPSNDEFKCSAISIKATSEIEKSGKAKKAIKNRPVQRDDRTDKSLLLDEQSSSSSSVAVIQRTLTRQIDADEESSWDEDKDTHEIWSKKSNNKMRSLDDYHTNDAKSKSKTKHIELSSSSDDNEKHTALTDEKSSPQSSTKRIYLCRLCGLPRKGHVCPYHSDVQHKAATSSFGNKRRRMLNDTVSVMEHATDKPWTEILAPAHIFLDEVNSFLQQCASSERNSNGPTSILDSEKSLLEIWAADVYNEFSQLNDRALENIEFVDGRKSVSRSINKERDSLVALRSKIRRIQNDNRLLEERITTLVQENNTNIAASKFLTAIDKLR